MTGKDRRPLRLLLSNDLPVTQTDSEKILTIVPIQRLYIQHAKISLSLEPSISVFGRGRFCIFI